MVMVSAPFLPLRRANARAFTLIELLVVIAMIGVLASVILASLNAARAKSSNAVAAQQIKEYQKALALHYSANGSYPGNTTWGCIGRGYTYTPGRCWTTSSYTETNTTAVALRSAVAPYMDGRIIPGYKSAVYGSMYRANGRLYDMILILEGDVTCPIGSKNVNALYSSNGVTRCDILNQGG